MWTAAVYFLKWEPSFNVVIKHYSLITCLMFACLSFISINNFYIFFAEMGSDRDSSPSVNHLTTTQLR